MIGEMVRRFLLWQLPSRRHRTHALVLFPASLHMVVSEWRISTDQLGNTLSEAGRKVISRPLTAPSGAVTRDKTGLQLERRPESAEQYTGIAVELSRKVGNAGRPRPRPFSELMREGAAHPPMTPDLTVTLPRSRTSSSRWRGHARQRRPLHHGRELTTRVARLFGWNRRGPDITKALDLVVHSRLEQGSLLADIPMLRPQACR